MAREGQRRPHLEAVSSSEPVSLDAAREKKETERKQAVMERIFSAQEQFMDVGCDPKLAAATRRDPEAEDARARLFDLMRDFGRMVRDEAGVSSEEWSAFLRKKAIGDRRL